MEKNNMIFQELAQGKIAPLKAELGTKTSAALVYFITRKLEHPEEKINEMASDCQEYMEKVFPGYMRRNGEDFLNEMEMDLEKHLLGKYNIPKDTFYNGHPVANLVKMYSKEIFEELLENSSEQ